MRGFGKLLMCCALFVLGASVPAFGQEEENAGILPVYDYSGGFTVRRAITGDWGGTRQEWADDGFTFEVDWYQTGQSIVSGGVESRFAYTTNLDYYATLDLARMDLVPGAVVTVRGQSRFGRTVNGDTGLLLPVNTYSLFPYTDELDENVSIAITELNWLQFISDEVALILGKLTTLSSSNEFAGGEGKHQFMNFQFIYPSVVAQVAPYSTLAVGGVWMASENVTLTSTLMNTTDSSTRSGFEDFGDGTSWGTVLDTRYDLGDLPGGLTGGFVYAFNGDFSRIGGVNIDPGGGISIDTNESTWALWLSSWQYLITEDESAEVLDPGNGGQDMQGIGVFGILGFGDKEANPVEWSIAAGFSGRGTIPGRDDDTWGAGWFYNSVEDPDLRVVRDLLTNSVQGIEVYYNIALTEAIALTLDFQWAASAVRSIDNSTILGLRLNMKF